MTYSKAPFWLLEMIQKTKEMDYIQIGLPQLSHAPLITSENIHKRLALSCQLRCVLLERSCVENIDPNRAHSMQILPYKAAETS